jgi:hypothetical protein
MKGVRGRTNLSKFNERLPERLFKNEFSGEQPPTYSSILRMLRYVQPGFHAKTAGEQTCLTAVRGAIGSALRSGYGLNEYTLRSLRKNSSVLLCVRKIAP